MKPLNKFDGSRSKTILAGVALFLGFLILQGTARADDPLPTFRQGMWVFHRTTGGKSFEIRKCTDPSEDILQKSGSKISSVKKAGKTYTFAADCPVVQPRVPQLGGLTTVVVTVESDSFYKVESDGLINGQPVKEYLDARRTGNCKK